MNWQDASIQARREQADAAFRDLAQMFGDWRRRLLAEDFSADGAELIVAIFAETVLERST